MTMTRPPRIDQAPGVLNQGDAVTLNGLGLTGATVTLGGRALTATAEGDTRMRITIPTDQVLGVAELVVSTPCGQHRASITVERPRPRILSIEPATPSPEALLYVSTDANPMSVTGVRLGTTTVPIANSASLRWLTGEPGPGSTLIVRMPAGAPAPVEFSIQSTVGVSDVRRIDLRPQPFGPPASKDITTFPRAADDDERHPIFRTNPFYLRDITTGAAFWNWEYRLTFRDVGLAPEVGATEPSVCMGHGTITGDESNCPGDCREVPDGVKTSPITGTFTYGRGKNEVSLTIDRRASGGQEEQYVGGWVWNHPVQTDDQGTYLVLRSRLSGIQILIDHRIFPGYCD
jgi:hypothetical protein